MGQARADALDFGALSLGRPARASPMALPRGPGDPALLGRTRLRAAADEIFQPLRRFLGQGPAHLPRQRHALRQRRGAWASTALLSSPYSLARRSAAPGESCSPWAAGPPRWGWARPRGQRRGPRRRAKGQIRRPFHGLEHTLTIFRKPVSLPPATVTRPPRPTQTSSFREVAQHSFRLRNEGADPSPGPHHGLRARGCVGVVAP